MLARKVEIRSMLLSMLMLVYMEMASNVMMLALGGEQSCQALASVKINP